MPRFVNTSRAGGALAVAAILVGAGCGGSSQSTGSTNRASTGSTKAAGAAPKPGTKFSIANVSGVGNVVVDGRGRTVYILTSGDHTNVSCTDANGCTKLWPDLPLRGGASAASAGTGVTASRLGTKKLSDGETYPTYNHWLMYEYSGDSGSGQAKGEGIKSFGGTSYVLNAAGDPVKSASGGYGRGGGY